MVIILKHIPSNIKKQDIVNFLAPAIVGSWWQKSAQIDKVLILLQKELHTNNVQHHVLVEICPDIAAERVIKKLHRQLMLGKRITVCEYKTRNWHNDKRIKYASRRWRDDRRTVERRRQYREIFSEWVL